MLRLFEWLFSLPFAFARLLAALLCSMFSEMFCRMVAGHEQLVLETLAFHDLIRLLTETRRGRIAPTVHRLTPDHHRDALGGAPPKRLYADVRVLIPTIPILVQRRALTYGTALKAKCHTSVEKAQGSCINIESASATCYMALLNDDGLYSFVSD